MPDIGSHAAAWMSHAFARAGFQHACDGAEAIHREIPQTLAERCQREMHIPTADRPPERREACTAYYHVKSLRSGAAKWFEQLAAQLTALGVLPALDAPAPHPTLIVDWGCGTGTFLLGLARVAVRGATDQVEYLGVDNDPTRIALARAVASDLGTALPSCTFDGGGTAPGFSVSRALARRPRPRATVVHVFANAWRQTRTATSDPVSDLFASAMRAVTDAERFGALHAVGAHRTVLVHLLTTAARGAPRPAQISPRVAASAMRRLMYQIEDSGHGRILIPCPHPSDGWTIGCPRPSRLPHPSAVRAFEGNPTAGVSELCVAAQCMKERRNLREYVLTHTLWLARRGAEPHASYRLSRAHTEGSGARGTCRCP